MEEVLALSDLATDPIEQFATWYAEARHSDAVLPQAMTLATVDTRGRPTARMVILDDFGPQGFVFYTHYQSHKARDLAGAPHAALVFYWAAQNRQVRIEGRVEKVSAAQSDTYFARRPRDSQLSAWASMQSETLPDRQTLAAEIRELDRQYAAREIPRPPHWGGYRVQPDRCEFWAERPDRLHDRCDYRLGPDGAWTLSRLAP